MISVWALEQSLEKRGDGKERHHSGTSTSIDRKTHPADGEDEQGLEQSRSSGVPSEGINSSVQTVISNSVSNKLSDMVGDYQHSVYEDVNRVNPENEDALSTSKFSCTWSHEIDKSWPGDATEIPSPTSVTSRNPDCPGNAFETSCRSGEIYPQMEQECSSGSAASEDNLPKLKVNASRNMFEQQDLLIPWHYHGKKNSSKNSKESSCTLDSATVDKDGRKLNSAVEGKDLRIFQRFYHVFKEHELTNECSKLGDVFIVRSYYDKGNWCIELEKVRDH